MLGPRLTEKPRITVFTLGQSFGTHLCVQLFVSLHHSLRNELLGDTLPRGSTQPRNQLSVGKNAVGMSRAGRTTRTDAKRYQVAGLVFDNQLAIRWRVAG